MELTSKQIYYTILTGAHSVINNKETLNKTNVFPVRDGDTGSNLASMMRTIIQKAESKHTVKQTLESIADAALYGARGNSGIIFAQYLNGLSESVSDVPSISIYDYAKASNEAVLFAYNAIEEAVEGTMLTIMREWGNALTEEIKTTKSLIDVFSNAYARIEIALERTKNQLEVLRKANVVDSGAKGFTYFIEGALYYIKNGKDVRIEDIKNNENVSYAIDMEEQHSSDNTYRYCTECLLEGNNINSQEIKDFLQKKGNSTVVAGSKNKCRIHIHTNDPAEIFEYLYEKGTIVYQKVDDMFKQEAIINNQRSKIALVTDSIGDLPQDFIDENQIHIVHLDVLYNDYIYG